MGVFTWSLMYCANDLPFHVDISIGLAPNDADSRNRANSALKSRVADVDRVCNTYRLPGGIIDVQLLPEQTHSGALAMNDPPARSQL